MRRTTSARSRQPNAVQGAGFFLNFLLDIQIRFGMGLPMKQNYTHPARRKTVDECHEIQSPPRRATAQTESQNPSQPKREKKKEPEWRNLTLDELKSWLEDAKREQGITDETSVPL